MSILTDTEIAIIKGLAHCAMNISRTATHCGYSRQTLYYKLYRIEAKTGLDPKSFDGLVKLLTMVGYFEKEF